MSVALSEEELNELQESSRDAQLLEVMDRIAAALEKDQKDEPDYSKALQQIAKNLQSEPAGIDLSGITEAIRQKNADVAALSGIVKNLLTELQSYQKERREMAMAISRLQQTDYSEQLSAIVKALGNKVDDGYLECKVTRNKWGAIDTVLVKKVNNG